MTTFAALVLAGSGATAASPHAKARPHAPVPSCPDALDDGTLVDGRLADVLARLVPGAHWLDAATTPPEAGARVRDVRLRCGPDLDGDGDREAIATVTYDVHDADALESQIEASPATYYLLVSKHGATWHAVAGLTVDVDDAPASEEPVAFVRRAGGRWAVEVRHTNTSSDSGCGVSGFERLELKGGVLRVVESGDRSRPCLPCGCDG